MTAAYDRALAPAGLRVTQYSLLAALRRETGDAGWPLSVLAERMDMDRTTLTRNLGPLVARGWARLAPDPADARVHRALVTAEGAAAFAAARPHWQAAQHEVQAILGAATVASLHDWLDAVTPALRPAGERS